MNLFSKKVHFKISTTLYLMYSLVKQNKESFALNFFGQQCHKRCKKSFFKLLFSLLIYLSVQDIIGRNILAEKIALSIFS